MSYYPEFSRLLNQELQRRERSASWLAQRLGVSPSTVGRWLNDGMRPGTPEMVVQIADILGMPTEKQGLLTAAGYGYVDVPSGDAGCDQTAATALAAAAAHVHTPRLPVPPTPIVGRVKECAQINAWIMDPVRPLVTIVGPGGMGKTRLALAVAQEQEKTGHFEHGVAFADLAPLREVEQLPVAVAQAAGLPLESATGHTRSPRQQVLDFLRSRHLLLLLDNAEHLLDGAEFVSHVLHYAPGVQILVTSRIPLALPQEHLYPLRGLDYGQKTSATDTTSDETITPAAALFIQSAQHVHPNFGTDVMERKGVVEICRLVEGMPLAIELAASWVPVLPAEEIADEIRRGLDFLETDLRQIPDRHRSMEAVFDASWQRLDEREQQIFAQLSVFRGGFTRHAVRHVTGADLRLLRALSAKSLLVYDRARNRYTIHELLRQYGASHLAEWPALEVETGESHGAFYIDLLRRHQDALKRRGYHAGLAALDVEADNLSRAWYWAANHGHVAGITATMDGLGLYLQWRGRPEEGETTFQSTTAALRRAGEMRHLARALAWQALFTRILGKGQLAIQLLEQSRNILDGNLLPNTDTRSERAFVLMQMGAAVAGQDTEAAQSYYEQSLSLFKALDEQWFVAEVLLELGHVLLTLGDFAGHRMHVQRALSTYRSLGNERGEAAAMSMLGNVDTYQGRADRGLRLGRESLAAFQSLGDPAGIADCLSRISLAQMNLGQVDQARRSAQESAAIFAEIGSRRDEVIAYAFRSAIELMAGDYIQAHAFAQRSLAIASDLDDQFVLGVALSFVGWAHLFIGDCDSALQMLRAGVTVTKGTGAASDLTRCYAILGLAEWNATLHHEARAHCLQSVRLCVRVADPWAMLTAMGATIAILADGEDPVRALELYSMLRQDPLCASSRWFEDGIGPHVSAAMDGLPDEVVEAAIDRGKCFEQQEEAAKLSEELSALGWVP